MARFSILCVVAMLISGCNGGAVVRDLDKTPDSGVKGGKTFLVLLNAPPAEVAPADLGANDLKLDDDLDRAAAACVGKARPDIRPMAGLAIPVISAVGKLIFDLFMDQQIRKLDAEKKAAQATYGDRAITTTDGLRAAKCLLLVRFIENKAKNNERSIVFGAVLRLQARGTTAFTMEPVYARVVKAAAKTKEGDAENAAHIAVSFGVSVKAIARQRQPQPSLALVGQGGVSIPGKVDIGAKAKPYACDGRCASTDLVAYPLGKADPVSIELAVTETGDLGIDFDRRAAELKAIKEAIGPVLKDFLKGALEDD